ncbi:unnamed protein product [Periconia digitata]|uniref:Ribonuclease H1 N-terminal domain-containing protein n=1 Tax=Periconia digitata TaxID=1303443 RepID=A0A9W4U1A3_9PLEO|nr:unnamed protein product [Periconia digitata]
MGRKKNKEYYAVFSGRVDEPTIFSSWGDAHPRVTGCEAVMKGFASIEKARQYMKELGISECKEVIKETALNTTPANNDTAYYAVAYGSEGPCIKPYWYGDKGAFEETDKAPYACHKHFRTEAQAEAFIEDWKEAYAEVIYRAVKEGFSKGMKPRDLKLNLVESLFEEPSDHDIEEIGETFSSQLTLA